MCITTVTVEKLYVAYMIMIQLLVCSQMYPKKAFQLMVKYPWFLGEFLTHDPSVFQKVKDIYFTFQTDK